MIRLLLLLLALLPSLSHAQASAPLQPYCIPNNNWLKGAGTDYNVFETAEISGRVGWCPSSEGGWHITVHQWCQKSLCTKTTMAIMATSLGAAIDRVKAASAPASQIATEWASWGVPLKTDLEKWHFRDWKHQACLWLISKPFPLQPPGGFAPTWDPTPAYCDSLLPGVKPVEQPPVVVYVVTGTVSGQRDYYNVVNGVRQTAPAGKVNAGTVCDCSKATGLEIIEFNVVRYCKIPATGLAVTNCSVKK